MLARTSYDPAQLATCRQVFAELQDSWQKVAARSEVRARAEAELRVFNQMVVALDGWFVHRQRSLEGKDGNALNEVRLIAAGITGNGGCFPADATIRWNPEASITGLRPGDPIRITGALFARLCAAFLDGIATHYPG